MGGGRYLYPRRGRNWTSFDPWTKMEGAQNLGTFPILVGLSILRVSRKDFCSIYSQRNSVAIKSFSAIFTNPPFTMKIEIEYISPMLRTT